MELKYKKLAQYYWGFTGFYFTFLYFDKVQLGIINLRKGHFFLENKKFSIWYSDVLLAEINALASSYIQLLINHIALENFDWEN